MASPIVSPKGEMTPAKDVTESASLTAEQYRLILEVIAGRMATLHQLIIQANAVTNDEFLRGVCGDSAEALANYLGAMADEALGGEIIGDANHWNYGPNFATAGKEAHHG